MPNDAKSDLDKTTHALQDQPAARGRDQHEAAKSVGGADAKSKKAIKPSDTKG